MKHGVAFMKIIRAYEIEMLDLIFEKMIRYFKDSKPKSEADDLDYASGAICKIIILLHYLSCMWIYAGSEVYLGYEEGHIPWQFANEDFLGMDRAQIYVFSTYWVCTVITTVGYGDYSGGTTAEYGLTIFLEFFGLVIFTILQVAVNRLTSGSYNFDDYYHMKTERIELWLLTMEKANLPYHLPGEMIAHLRKTAKMNLTKSFNIITDEYGFWKQLPEKYKSELVKIIFYEMLPVCETFLTGCEQAFINNFMVNLQYRKDYAGQVIQHGSQKANEMFIIWSGVVIVTERTEFHEPILIYTRGTAFNLYQIMMRCDLPLDYRAAAEDEYFSKYNLTVIQPMHALRKEQIVYNQHRFRPYEYPKTAKEVELYTIEKHRLLALLDAFPRAN